MAMSLTVYGTKTCEDTAITRDRLKVLQVAFVEFDVEADPVAARYVERVNGGRRVTPTLALDGGEIVLTEPSIEQLEATLGRAGYTFHLPQGVEYRGEMAARPIPDFSLPSSAGADFRLGKLRGRSMSVLFFGHGRSCRVCAGYTRQLLALQSRFGEDDLALVVVLEDGQYNARAWSEEFVGGYPVLADATGSVKHRLAEYFGADPHGLLLLVLDQYTAPRAGSFAADAGGLIAPGEVGAWLRLLDQECGSACSIEINWAAAPES